MRLHNHVYIDFKKQKFICGTHSGSHHLDGVTCGPAYAYSCKVRGGGLYNVRTIAIKSTVDGSVNIGVLMNT